MVAVDTAAVHIVAAGMAWADMVAGKADEVHQMGAAVGTTVVVAVVAAS